MRWPSKALLLACCLALMLISGSMMNPATVHAQEQDAIPNSTHEAVFLTPPPERTPTPSPSPPASPESSATLAIHILDPVTPSPIPTPTPEATPRSSDAIAATPLPEGEEPKYRLTIDVTNQVVCAWRKESADDASYSVLVREMICSTGTKKDPTPLGTFVMPDSTRYRWSFFPKFKVYAQYQTRIKGSILFHSVLYNKNRLNTLVTGSYNNLGKRASHGCIRLLPEDARWIYEYCPPGTEVEVFEGEAEEGVRDRLRPMPLKEWYPEHAKDPPESLRSPLAYAEENYRAGSDWEDDADFGIVEDAAP